MLKLKYPKIYDELEIEPKKQQQSVVLTNIMGMYYH